MPFFLPHPTLLFDFCSYLILIIRCYMRSFLLAPPRCWWSLSQPPTRPPSCQAMLGQWGASSQTAKQVRGASALTCFMHVLPHSADIPSARSSMLACHVVTFTQNRGGAGALAIRWKATCVKELRVQGPTSGAATLVQRTTSVPSISSAIGHSACAP